MTTPASIHFIGRRQGIIPYSNTNWFLENSRNQELAGIRNIPNIKIVNSKKKADIIFVRNKPESTTDQQVQKINSVIKAHRKDKLVINDIKDLFLFSFCLVFFTVS